jgi:hypothetical protein
LECGAIPPLCFLFLFPKKKSGGKAPHSKAAEKRRIPNQEPW